MSPPPLRAHGRNTNRISSEQVRQQMLTVRESGGEPKEMSWFSG